MTRRRRSLWSHEEELSPFAQLLVTYMREHHIWSQALLADQLGVKPTTLNAWMHNRAHMPQRATLRRIHERLDIPLADLYRAVGIEIPAPPYAPQYTPAPAPPPDPWEYLIASIRDDDTLSVAERQAQIDRLNEVRHGRPDPMERYIIAEHVVESAPPEQTPSSTPPPATLARPSGAPRGER